MVGKGDNKYAKTRIATEDNEGRVIDLHAMRTKLGTDLARAGVAPQIAQRIMRHSDYRTTLQHYTVLGLTDTTQMIDKLTCIETTKRGAATGAYDETAFDASEGCHPKPRQFECESLQFTALEGSNKGAPKQARRNHRN